MELKEYEALDLTNLNDLQKRAVTLKSYYYANDFTTLSTGSRDLLIHHNVSRTELNEISYEQFMFRGLSNKVMNLYIVNNMYLYSTEETDFKPIINKTLAIKGIQIDSIEIVASKNGLSGEWFRSKPQRKPKLVYIAGPYRADTVEAVKLNIESAKKTALLVLEKGYYPVTPHLNSALFELLANVDDQFYLDHTLELMERCNAVVMSQGWQESQGATAEYERAKEIKQTVYESYADLPDLNSGVVQDA